MTLSCLHTHTTFCDGAADVETMCEAAFARGFVSIGFSSHGPITKKTGIKNNSNMQDEKLDEYIDTVLAARKRWAGKLAVFLGLEVDYIQGLLGPADAEIQALPLDYILGAVHYCICPKTGEFFIADERAENFGRVLELFGNDGRALCEAYFDSYCGMIAAGGYDILAHLDLIKKNNRRFRFFSPGDSWYTELLVKTADLIAAVQTGAGGTGGRIPVVEVNTGGINRGYCTEPYPSLDMLKLLKQRNIPLVVNADAHAPEQLGGSYETAMETMRQAGYRTMALFEGRENKSIRWREEPL